MALVKTDLKKLAAFSTLSHVSFVALGIFTFTILGTDGGVFQFLNESLIGAALFILLGLLYERYGTYDIRDYGGLATKHPWMVTLFVITTLAAVGLPMMNGFVGEFLILSGTMQSFAAHHVFWTVLATTGVIFSAAYMLWMIQRVFYGSLGLRSEEVTGWDLDPREHLELWPLAALFLIMGIASPFWMKAIDTYGTLVADKPAHPRAFQHQAQRERNLRQRRSTAFVRRPLPRQPPPKESLLRPPIQEPATNVSQRHRHPSGNRPHRSPASSS